MIDFRLMLERGWWRSIGGAPNASIRWRDLPLFSRVIAAVELALIGFCVAITGFSPELSRLVW